MHIWLVHVTKEAIILWKSYSPLSQEIYICHRNKNKFHTITIVPLTKRPSPSTTNVSPLKRPHPSHKARHILFHWRRDSLIRQTNVSHKAPWIHLHQKQIHMILQSILVVTKLMETIMLLWNIPIGHWVSLTRVNEMTGDTPCKFSSGLDF